MTQMLIAAAATFAACLIAVPLVLGLARAFGLYAIVPERRCYVYILFGKVIATIEEPGLHFLFAKMGWRAFVINFFGRRHVLDMRRDQIYLRSQPANSEEGAPMGIGIWYEMFISDPVAYLLKYRTVRLVYGNGEQLNGLCTKIQITGNPVAEREVGDGGRVLIGNPTSTQPIRHSLPMKSF